MHITQCGVQFRVYERLACMQAMHGEIEFDYCTAVHSSPLGLYINFQTRLTTQLANVLKKNIKAQCDIVIVIPCK